MTQIFNRIVQILEMQDLKEQFIQQGLTPEQADDALHTITEWLKQEYPVAGVLLSSWMKNQSVSRLD